jgi:hypothetical protein
MSKARKSDSFIEIKLFMEARTVYMTYPDQA